MRTKDEAFERIKRYMTLIKNKFDRQPKYLRLDNGKELINEKLKSWTAELGIELELMAPYSPAQNGIAERFN